MNATLLPRHARDDGSDAWRHVGEVVEVIVADVRTQMSDNERDQPERQRRPHKAPRPWASS